MENINFEKLYTGEREHGLFAMNEEEGQKAELESALGRLVEEFSSEDGFTLSEALDSFNDRRSGQGVISEKVLDELVEKGALSKDGDVYRINLNSDPVIALGV